MKTSLYIPEIGDKIVLAEPLTFDLHAEGRNSDLAAAFGHYLDHAGWIDQSVLPPMRDPDYKVFYPDKGSPEFKDWRGRFDYEKWNRAAKEAEEGCTEKIKYEADYRVHNEAAKGIGKETIQVTLPAGTELTVSPSRQPL
jgi:hypothetical protein